MSDMELKLRGLVKQWRATAEQARQTSEHTDNLMARGHLLGTAEALDVAAEEIEALLSEMAPR